MENCRSIASKAKILVASYQSTLKTKYMGYWLDILCCQGVVYPGPSPSGQLTLVKYLAIARLSPFLQHAR
ncbi:MAG: hypothetical protein KME52_23820 [Desmonostoc geniculatum HA4340-LM1]|nr:hypothetical protein [Desmonostoc geniculatum HA4340-LM1]